MSPFEEHVQAALDELPRSIVDGLENVAIVIEDQHPDDPELFGLWEADAYLPDKVTIFERPLRRATSRQGDNPGRPARERMPRPFLAQPRSQLLPLSPPCR